MITGRIKETELLEKRYASDRSEFVALYGRRRVGKTYLVRTVLGRRITFQLTGLAGANLGTQLQNFNLALKESSPELAGTPAGSWMEAFGLLRRLVERSRQQKKVLFIDELPWFDTPHSGFIHALEHFWNSWASARKDVLLVVCGSAASWMIGKLINSRGGLHNRVTQRIRVEPFTLAECEQLLRHRRIAMDRYQLLQLYMVLGGIPFYWDALEKGESAAQCIQRICFDSNGLLRNEFRNLFASLFSRAERHESVVNALARKSRGLGRDELAALSGLSNGGGFTRILTELEESGFIRRYVPFGKKMRNSLYQLTDFFSLFHLRFMTAPAADDENYWLKMIDQPAYRAWSGYAFEQVCLAHVPQLKKALGISGVETSVASWKSSGQAAEGAQVDLVIDRRDGIINLCEMKFSLHPFRIDKKYDAILRTKAGVFKSETDTSKSVFLTMITTFGLQPNIYSANVQNDLDMHILFRD